STWPSREMPQTPLPIELPVRSNSPRTPEASGQRRLDFSGEVVAAVSPFETDTPVLRAAAAQAAIYGAPLHLVGVTATHVISPEVMLSLENLVRMCDDEEKSVEAAI